MHNRMKPLLGLILTVFLLTIVAPTTQAQQQRPTTFDVILMDITTGDLLIDDQEFTFEIFLELFAQSDETLIEMIQDQDANLTVFVPTDEAFEAWFETLTQAQLDTILDDPDLITQLLSFHIIEGTATEKDILAYVPEGDAIAIPTLLEDFELAFQNTDNVLQIGEAEVLEPDIIVENGIIFVIDTVLIPTETP